MCDIKNARYNKDRFLWEDEYDESQYVIFPNTYGEVGYSLAIEIFRWYMSNNRAVCVVEGGSLQEAYSVHPGLQILLVDQDNLREKYSGTQRHTIYSHTINKLHHITIEGPELPPNLEEIE